jgi:proteasome lid subunit RPN8/RPN11
MLARPWQRLRLPQSLYEGMLAQARAERPLECCGLLAGVIGEDGSGVVQERYPLVNAAASPVEFLSSPESMFAAHKDMWRRNLEMLAVYHSHPTSAPVPSKKDLAQSSGPGIVNLIISLTTEPPTVRCWWLEGDTFREAEWEVVPDVDPEDSRTSR